MAESYETLVLERTTSTQDEVRMRAGAGPLLVVAECQTEGRGRSGAGWDNAPRALAASLGVRPILAILLLAAYDPDGRGGGPPIPG